MIEKYPFGRTGHLSTRTIFGAAAFGSVTQQEADATLEVLLQHGVNHIDTAASYGVAEERIGPWMQQHRSQFFLATKTGARDYAGARHEIQRSLQRLQVEQIDLLQLHNLVDENEWQTALGPGGALEAAVEAREAGQIRFIGITGHGLQVARQHRKSLERFDFDSVLLPCNYLMLQNEQYAADFHALRQTCRERNVAMQTIKAITRRPWGEQPQNRATWYQPLEDPAAIEKAVHWLLGHESLFLNTVGDIYLLPEVLEAAGRFDGENSAVTGAEMEELLQSGGMAPLFV
jgi:aryl-alcohol dehydrogenase-like predicted oxidoreductase